MQRGTAKIQNRRSVTDLPVVRNFQKVIGSRDIMYMKKELYEFLHLHCGFIAHFNIDGFKATYGDPQSFCEVFIRHFDGDHPYFSGVYACHNEPHKDTGFTKADIKEEFIRIVDIHKDAIEKWAHKHQRRKRFDFFKTLKEEFEPKGVGMKIGCDACLNEYEIKVVKEGEAYSDFGIICCVFCGQQIKLY
jgi:hypothetical protein